MLNTAEVLDRTDRNSLASIVPDVLRRRSSLPEELRARLKGHLRTCIDLFGFKDASKAEPAQLTQPLIRVCQSKKAVMQTMIEAWLGGLERPWRRSRALSCGGGN